MLELIDFLDAEEQGVIAGVEDPEQLEDDVESKRSLEMESSQDHT